MAKRVRVKDSEFGWNLIYIRLEVLRFNGRTDFADHLEGISFKMVQALETNTQLDLLPSKAGDIVEALRSLISRRIASIEVERAKAGREHRSAEMSLLEPLQWITLDKILNEPLYPPSVKPRLELERGKVSRGATEGPQAPEGPAGPEPPSTQARRRRWPWILAAVAVLIGLGYLISAFAGSRSEPLRLESENNRVKVVGVDTGRVYLDHSYESSVMHREIRPWGKVKQALVVTTGNEHIKDAGLIFILDPVKADTLLLDRVSVEFLSTVYADPEIIDLPGVERIFFYDFDLDGHEEAVTVTRGRYYVSTVRVYSPTRGLLGTYCHTGHLDGFASLELRSLNHPALVVWGTNNAHRGATVIMLDPLSCDGASATTASERERILPGIKDAALARGILPGLAQEIMEAIDYPRLHVNKVGVMEGALPTSTGGTKFLRCDIGDSREESLFQLDLDTALEPLGQSPLQAHVGGVRLFRERQAEGRLKVKLSDPAVLDRWLAEYIRIEAGRITRGGP
ncbi:MAG: hypothetical protein R3C71_15710 [Candidatus Krumholzibacteriia bacterium]